MTDDKARTLAWIKGLLEPPSGGYPIEEPIVVLDENGRYPVVCALVYDVEADLFVVSFQDDEGDDEIVFHTPHLSYLVLSEDHLDIIMALGNKAKPLVEEIDDLIDENGDLLDGWQALVTAPTQPRSHDPDPDGDEPASARPRRGAARQAELARIAEEDDAILLAAGVAHGSYLLAASRAAGPPLGDARILAAAFGVLDGTIDGMGLAKTPVELMGLATTFLAYRMSELEIMADAAPEAKYELMAHAMFDDDFAAVRAHAGIMAYGFQPR